MTDSLPKFRIDDEVEWPQYDGSYSPGRVMAVIPAGVHASVLEGKLGAAKLMCNPESPVRDHDSYVVLYTPPGRIPRLAMWPKVEGMRLATATGGNA